MNLIGKDCKDLIYKYQTDMNRIDVMCELNQKYEKKKLSEHIKFTGGYTNRFDNNLLQDRRFIRKDNIVYPFRNTPITLYPRNRNRKIVYYSNYYDNINKCVDFLIIYGIQGEILRNVYARS